MITKPAKYPPEWIIKELQEWIKFADNEENQVFLMGAIPIKMKRRYSFEDMRTAVNYNVRKKDEFSNKIATLYSRISKIIETRVQQGALTGKLNANIAQLTLKAKHKWEDKTVIDNKHTLTKVKDEDLQDDIAKELASITE